MKVLILLGLVALICWIIYLRIRRNLKNKREVVTAYTGTMGSGKTLLCVQDAIPLILKAKKRYKRWHWLKKKKKTKVYENKIAVSNEEPQLFSNIPIIIGYEKGKPLYSCKLTNEILLLQEAIPENSIVVIDEIGKYASQFDYKNPNITDALDEFIRLYRHYVNGYILCNEQSSNFIELHIRKRINTIHNLSNCFVIWRFIFYYDRQICIAEDINTVDIAQDAQKNKTDTQDNKSLKFKFMWYKKRYESRYLKLRYLRLPKAKLIKHNSLFTMDVLEIPRNKLVKPLTRVDESIKENEKKGEETTV